MSLEQVLTIFEDDEVFPEIQEVWLPGEPQSPPEDSSLVIDTCTPPARHFPKQPRPRRSPKKTHRGGWPPSRWLEWSEIKKINAAVYALATAGVPPTYHVTIMPLIGTGLGERKRACRRKIAHAGQALKRHGHHHFGITIFEHRTGIDLHAHHIIHVPRGERLTIERLTNLPEVHVEPVPDLWGLVRYLTKERRPLPPDFERSIKYPRVPCSRMPGKRWSLTRAVKELSGDL